MNVRPGLKGIWVAAVVACLLLLSAAAGAEQIPPGYLLTAENQYLELYLNDEEAKLIVRHKSRVRSGGRTPTPPGTRSRRCGTAI